MSKSINQFISEKVNDRLQNALTKEEEQQQTVENIVIEEESKIITTEEELEAYKVIIAILRKKLPVNRIAYRDTQSYFGILLDDNNRKLLCRLHFNGKNKYLGIINENKQEIKQKIETIDDIYNYDDVLLKTIEFYN